MRSTTLLRTSVSLLSGLMLGMLGCGGSSSVPVGPLDPDAGLSSTPDVGTIDDTATTVDSVQDDIGTTEDVGAADADNTDGVDEDTAVEDVVEPDATELDAVELDAVELDVAEPDAAELDAVEPDTMEPDSGTSDIGEPDIPPEKTPCEANPCPTSKLAECVDDSYVTYLDGPSCNDETGKAVCTYEVDTDTHCDKDGYVCSDAGCIFPEKLCKGHMTVATGPDLIDAATCTAIDGNLIISTTTLGYVSLPHLESVGGALIIKETMELKEVDLSGLVTVGAQFNVISHASLQVLKLDSLSSVGGAVVFKGNAGELSFNAPALATVVGPVNVFNNIGLKSVQIPALKAVSALTVSGNALLDQVSAGNLDNVTGSIIVRNNAVMKSLEFPALTAASSLSVTDNAQLMTLQLDGLSTLDGVVVVRDNAALPALSLPSLKESGGIAVFSSVALETLSFEVLSSLKGPLVIQNNASLTSVVLPALVSADDVYIAQCQALASLTFDLLETALGQFIIRENPLLSTVELPGLKTIGKRLAVDNNDGLATLKIPALVSGGGAILVAQNKALLAIEFPELTTAAGSVVVVDNDTLTDLSMPKLVTTGVTSTWANLPIVVGSKTFQPSGPLSVHILVGEERSYTAKTNKWGHLGTINDLEDQDVCDMLEEDCTLGDTEVSLEVHLEDVEYYLTTFEYTKENNDKGFMTTLPAPEAGWQLGWNKVVFSTQGVDYKCKADTGCNSYCDLPWSTMNRLEFYRSGPSDDPKPVTIKVRNVHFTKFNAVGSLACSKNVAIAGNAALPDCVANTSASGVTGEGVAVAIQDNLEGCTCEGHPMVVTCPEPDPEPEPDPDPAPEPS